MFKTNKKGFENISSFITAVGATIVFVVLLVITLKFTYFSEEVKCKATDFQFGELQDKISLMLSAGSGDREEKEFTVPCGDRAYFFNLNKKQELLSSGSLRDEPLLEDAVRSDTDTNKNFFIMKKNKIVGSFSLGDIRLDYPYNLCFDLKARRKVKLALDDLGAKVMITPNCEQVECTVVPEKLEQPEIETLLNDICKNDPNFDDCKNAERQNIENAKGNIDVKLKVSTCFPETTKVEFIIKPTRDGIAAKEVKLIETIDKNCMNNDLKAYLKKLEGGTAEIIMRANPMIVWTFPTLSEEQKVAYHLSKYLDDNCRKQLRAVAGAELIVDTNKITDVEKPIEQVKVSELDDTFKRSLITRNILLPSSPAQTVFTKLPSGERAPSVRAVTAGQNEMKPHKQRFEPRNPANPSLPNTNLPADFIVIPEDKKGKPIFIVPEPTAPGGIAIIDEPERKGREEPPIVVSNILPIILSITDGERVILGRPLCPNFLSGINQRLCPRLEYKIEKISGNGDAKCKVKIEDVPTGIGLKVADIICEGKTAGAANFRLEVKNRNDEVIAQKEFKISVS